MSRIPQPNPSTNRALLPTAKLHYNPSVHPFSRLLSHAVAGLILTHAGAQLCISQQPPNPSGARILIMPRKLVTGERATLAVLDVAGRLTPGVNVDFSDGEKVTTDTTGRALFVAPLNPGTIYAGIEGRSGRVAATVVTPAEMPSAVLNVFAAPRVASLADRFELAGHGFCGDADANHVTVAGQQGLMLASSPGSLVVLPPADLNPGLAQVNVSCGQKAAPPFSVVFVSMELEADTAALAPGEHRNLTVRVKGSIARISIEARNLSVDVAELSGGNTVRALSSGGADNVAKFELVGRKRGNFVISIRLVAPLSAPRQ